MIKALTTGTPPSLCAFVFFFLFSLRFVISIQFPDFLSFSFVLSILSSRDCSCLLGCVSREFFDAWKGFLFETYME